MKNFEKYIDEIAAKWKQGGCANCLKVLIDVCNNEGYKAPCEEAFKAWALAEADVVSNSEWSENKEDGMYLNGQKISRSDIARLMSKIPSEKKRQASRENGKKYGGRPQKKECVTCIYYVYSLDKCSFPNSIDIDKANIHPCENNPCEKWERADAKEVHKRRVMRSLSKKRIADGGAI